MTLEVVPDPPSEEAQREQRQRSYRSLATGLIIQASRYLGTFDIETLTPSELVGWMRLATELHDRVDATDGQFLIERRQRYLETIRAE